MTTICTARALAEGAWPGGVWREGVGALSVGCPAYSPVTVPAVRRTAATASAGAISAAAPAFAAPRAATAPPAQAPQVDAAKLRALGVSFFDDDGNPAVDAAAASPVSAVAPPRAHPATVSGAGASRAWWSARQQAPTSRVRRCVCTCVCVCVCGGGGAGAAASVTPVATPAAAAAGRAALGADRGRAAADGIAARKQDLLMESVKTRVMQLMGAEQRKYRWVIKATSLEPGPPKGK